MLKELSISFLKVTIIQDIKTVIFYVLLVYKATFLLVFGELKSVRVSYQFDGLFIRYVSTSKFISLVMGPGYIKVKINKYELW